MSALSNSNVTYLTSGAATSIKSKPTFLLCEHHRRVGVEAFEWRLCDLKNVEAALYEQLRENNDDMHTSLV